MNNSAAEESSLFRVLLSSTKLRRDGLDFARAVLTDRNRDASDRQWAAVLLGRHGDAADHGLIAKYHLDDEALARASVIAIQAADPTLRGTVLADIGSRFPAQLPLIARVRGLRSPLWPEYEP
jgi:hypothetical protein